MTAETSSTPAEVVTRPLDRLVECVHEKTAEIGLHALEGCLSAGKVARGGTCAAKAAGLAELASAMTRVTEDLAAALTVHRGIGPAHALDALDRLLAASIAAQVTGE